MIDSFAHWLNEAINQWSNFDDPVFSLHLLLVLNLRRVPVRHARHGAAARAFAAAAGRRAGALGERRGRGSATRAARVDERDSVDESRAAERGHCDAAQADDRSSG